MADWNGKSRGTVTGLKVFVFFMHYFGMRAAYALLILPVPYFVLASPKSTRNIFTFFHKRIGYSKLRSFGNIFKTYFVLGQVLIDRIALTTPKKSKFTFEFDGIHFLKEKVQQKESAILLTAHVGNFNASKSFFEDIQDKPIINMVMTDNEHEAIKDYLESVTGEQNIKHIVIRDDFEHIFKINNALDQNELLVFAADRRGEGAHFKRSFLEKESEFFTGPFKLAAIKKAPVLFVYIFREPGFHYHFYARKFESEDYSAENILNAYAKNLEELVRKYPNQWFNFYDFWNDFKSTK